MRKKKATNLLVLGDREQKLGVQFAVVLGQRLVAIVIDELHHGQEGKRLREAVPPVSVVNLYKLVVPPFPAGGDKRRHGDMKKTAGLGGCTCSLSTEVCRFPRGST